MVSVQEFIDLHPFTTFRVGGKARYFAEAKSETDLLEVLKWAKEKSISVFMLGGGSNVLFADRGYDGMVVKIELTEIASGDEGTLRAGAGATLHAVLEYAKEKGFGGLEKLAGIPGTLGGAVRGNAGAFGVDMASVVSSVRALDQHTVEARDFSREACQFGYRMSLFKKCPELVILSAELLLVPHTDSLSLGTLMRETIDLRERKHPQNMLCAGSFFMNPTVTDERLRKEFERDTGESAKSDTLPAGWLIDHVGLRGKEIGGAKVSDIHPNYIVNTGTATAESILILASLIKQRVRTELGIRLREEVQMAGF